MARVNKKQYRLFLFVFIIVLATVTLSLILSNTISFISVRDTTNSQIIESHKAVIKLFVDNIEKDVKFGIIPEVYRKCDALSKNDSILGVEVLSQDREFCKFGDNVSGQSLSSNIYFGENNNDIAATVKITFSSTFKKQILSRHIQSVIIGLILIILILVYPLYLISRRLTHPIEDLASLLPEGDISKIDEQLKGKESNIKEIGDLYKSTRTMAKEIKRYEFENIEKAKKEYLYKKASGIVHDIRNPILRLKLKIGVLISDLALKNNINNDLEFIEELTREMLSEYRSESQEVKDSSKLVEISRIIEKNISNLRFSFPDCEINFHNNLNQIGAYLEILPLSLSRILQNLIKNACEAKGDDPRVVDISLNKIGGFYEISVKDNGNGISKDIIEKVTDEGFTYGKEAGTGIGLSYCKDEISRFNGELEVDSKEGEYALLKVSFPVQKSPIWGFSNLYLQEGSTLVIVDDEQEIHSYWSSIAKKMDFSSKDIKVVSLFSSDELKSFVKHRPRKDIHLIFDYDLKESKGVDLIRKHRLQKCSTIISSHYDDPTLIEFCEFRGVRLFPKQSIESLKIEILDKKSNLSTKDVIFIDDDRELLDAFIAFVTKNKCRAFGYQDLDQFLKEKSIFSESSIFFIDLNSTTAEDGLVVSRELFSMGYKNLYILSGEEIDTSKYFWIKELVSKSELDKVLQILG